MSSLTQSLGSWVRILLDAWMPTCLFLCVVLCRYRTVQVILPTVNKNFNKCKCKIIVESGRIAPQFLAPSLDGGKWSASRTRRSNLGEEATSSHCTGSWVDPRVGLNTVRNGEKLDQPITTEEQIRTTVSVKLWETDL
jgi:hypothetical protein